MAPSLLTSFSAIVLTTALVATPTAEANSTAAHAPFGNIKSKPGACVVSDPKTYISPKDLQWVWDNRMKSEVGAYDNWVMDHLVANKGTINYCVRCDSQQSKLSKAQAAKFQAMLTRQQLRLHFAVYKTGSRPQGTRPARGWRVPLRRRLHLQDQHALWNRWLIGYNCWPYNEIKVNIVGWAAREASDLGWSDGSLGKIYIGDLDQDGAPQCPENCYRSVDGSPGGWSESSGCDGKPFDISLWPKQAMAAGLGGLGTSNFIQVDLNDMLEHIDDNELTIVAHEMGHSFGLSDFYEQPKPANFKPCLMDALTSDALRDTDGWMLRRVLDNKKSKYNF
ncbi:hypothetical protein PF006_g24424 [Phytophthora fragariae]|uniref:Peptidase M10 metallopeptidase domain-containing protein n=2 Tax=Phytophthora fragariae TaxID=53985 RepID=A0A6A3RDJ2_9STRA|nr:hypothetical protein PF006_g24424 [Phytophthora fragariae]